MGHNWPQHLSDSMSQLGQTLPKWVVRDMSGLPAIPTKDQRSRCVLNVPLRTMHRSILAQPIRMCCLGETVLLTFGLR